MSEGVEVKIDTDGMEKRLESKFDAKFKKLEELLTPKLQTAAISEKKASDAKIPGFDWRIGIAEKLSSFKKSDNFTSATWQDRRKIEDVSIIEYDEKTKQHKYGLTEKLVETIGTIAQGTNNCCIPEIWADKIERDHIYPGSVFLGKWFVNWYDEIEGKLMELTMYSQTLGYEIS